MKKNNIEDQSSKLTSSSKRFYAVDPSINDLQNTALDLICQRYELTKQDEIFRAFLDEQEFKKQSKRHLKAFENAEVEWSLLGQLESKELTFVERTRLKLEQKLASTIDNPKPILAMASVILLVVILPFMVSFQPPVSQLTKQHSPLNKNIEHYRTGYGYRSEYILADGSVVNLNWNSSISVNLTKNQRLVTLHNGEAYFKVAKNAQRPFIVSVDNVKAQAIGTEFNVKKGADNVADIAVTEGIVAVSIISSHQGIQKEVQQKMLVANETVTSQGTSLNPVNTSSSENIIAWRQGIIVFDKQPLSHALEEINRYTSYNMIINLKDTNDDNVTASFFVDSADDAMYSLIELFNLHIEKRGNNIIITKKT
jgi:transmembrane sensor